MAYTKDKYPIPRDVQYTVQDVRARVTELESLVNQSTHLDAHQLADLIADIHQKLLSHYLQLEGKACANGEAR